MPVRTTVQKSLAYILNPDKTEQLLYTASLNCMTDAANAYLNMKAVYELYSGRSFDEPLPKTGKGRVKVIHYIQSFSPDENITPEQAHRIAKAFVRKTFGDECQAVIATHTDRHHLHTHIILNTYSITGTRFYDSWHSRNHAQEYSDRVCLAFGIQPIEHSGRSKSTSYAEWYNRGRGTSWKERIRQELDRLVPEVKNLDELFAIMEEHGFTIKCGRYLMLKAPDQKRAIRLDNLGDLYSLDCLDIRILYHTGELQNCVRLTDLQKAYGLVLGDTITLKWKGKNRTLSPVMPDVHRLVTQLAIINRESIHSLGEVEGKIQAYRAECLRIAGEIERLDRATDDFEERLAGLRTQYEKAYQHYNVYSDIVQTYRTISQGDYISNLVKAEQKKKAEKAATRRQQHKGEIRK